MATTIALKTRKARRGRSQKDKAKTEELFADFTSEDDDVSTPTGFSQLDKPTSDQKDSFTVEDEDSVAYSEMAMRNNAAVMDYCRTSMSALGGATAGIMGLTSLHGFVFYFISSLLLSIMLMIKAGSRWNKYFVSRRILFLSGLFGGLFTYILFWTYSLIVTAGFILLDWAVVQERWRKVIAHLGHPFLYGMVHVY